jgi:hypothetical protein
MNANIVPYNKQTTLRSANSPNKNSYEFDYGDSDSVCVRWLKKIEQTLRWRRSNFDKDWKRAYEMYNGVHWRDIVETDPSSDQARDRITVNVTMSNVLSIVPFLISNKPKFICKPRRPEKDKVAQLQSEILNYEYEQRKMHKQVKAAAYDCVEIGHGIVKVGYALEIDKSKLKSDKSIQYESYIKENAPFVKRICPFYFLIDPCASENSLETAEWCAEIFFKSKRDLCANTKYNQTVINKIKSGIYNPGTKSTVFDSLSDANVATANDSYGTDDKLSYDDDDNIVLYELWSKRDRKYYILASGVHEPLLEKDWPFDYIDNFPYIKVDYIPIQDCLYGVGLPYTIEDQQFELNRVRTSAFEHRRRFNRKYTAIDTAISEAEANKLVNGPDGTVIFVKQQNAIVPIQEANLTQDHYAVEAMIKDDIRNLTGNDSLIQGGNLPSRTTSGEVQTRTNLFRLKLDDRAESINNFILEIGTQVLQHIKNNYNTDRLIALVGLKGINWERLSAEDIKEEMDVSMESVAAPKVDPMIDRQQRVAIWQQSIQALPLVQAGLLKIDFNQLFAWVMESFDYKDIGRFFDFDLVVQPPLQQVDGQSQQQETQLSSPNSEDQSQIGNPMSQLGGLFGGY